MDCDVGANAVRWESRGGRGEARRGDRGDAGGKNGIVMISQKGGRGKGERGLLWAMYEWLLIYR